MRRCRPPSRTPASQSSKSGTPLRMTLRIVRLRTCQPTITRLARWLRKKIRARVVARGVLNASIHVPNHAETDLDVPSDHGCAPLHCSAASITARRVVGVHRSVGFAQRHESSSERSATRCRGHRVDRPGQRDCATDHSVSLSRHDASVARDTATHGDRHVMAWDAVSSEHCSKTRI